MQVTTEKKFSPVTIVLETQQEFEMLLKICVTATEWKGDWPEGTAEFAMELENFIIDAVGP